MKKFQVLLLQLVIAVIPVVSLLFRWNKLPETLPMHWDLNNEVDRFGSKYELLIFSIVITVISLGVSLLMLNIDKLDPKRSFSPTSILPKKFSWTMVIFITLLNVGIIQESIGYQSGEPGILGGKFIGIALTLLFAVTGNFMNNLKPNYFIGIRTPWNLENAENWRLTHHLASKLWFYGGLAGLLAVVVLPSSFSVIIILIVAIPLALIPFWYSYRVFSKGH